MTDIQEEKRLILFRLKEIELEEKKLEEKKLEEKKLEEKKLEEKKEEQKKEEQKPLVLKFSHLDKRLNTIQLFISELDPYLRSVLNGFYLPLSNPINFNLKDIIKFGEALKDKNYIVQYSTPTLEQEIKDILNAPNLTIELFKDKTKIKITPNLFTAYIWLNGIDSFNREYTNNYYTIDINELWRLPLILNSNYPNLTRSYSPELLIVLEEQIKKRDALTILSKAEDVDINVPLINGECFHGFQRVALKFAENLNYNCILALDMGLGKTAIAIACVEKLNARALFIVPSTLKINTYREIKKWTGKETLILNKVSPDNADIDSLILNKKQYNIINYDVIGRVTKTEKEKKEDGNDEIMKWVELINMSKFDIIICDEAHYIKNMSSQRSKGTRLLISSHKIGLTGTPIVNRPGELYPILNVVAPDKFQSETSFISSYTTPSGQAKNVTRLHEVLQNYMFRKKKEDVIKELPPILRINHFCSLSQNAKINYEKALDGIYISLRNPNYKKEINTILAKITRLKQIIADDKVPTTVNLAADAYEDSKQKVLIFSQFIDSCIAIKQQLPDSLIITGLNNNDERYERIDKFQNDPSIKFMVLSTKAGSEGITLTAAHTVIFNDLCWTPKDHRQAEARCYGRMSDMHGALAYYVQVEKTIDEMIAVLLIKKLNVIEQVVDNLHTEQGESESIVMEFLTELKKRKGL